MSAYDMGYEAGTKDGKHKVIDEIRDLIASHAFCTVMHDGDKTCLDTVLEAMEKL